MVTKKQLDHAVARAQPPGFRIAVLGALLAKESKLGAKLVIVGGSALSVYSGGTYVSKDIDLVAKSSRVVPVLRRWGFTRVERSGRAYWVRDDLGLVLDVIDRDDYVGLNDGTHVERTRYGPVRVAAVEDLIIRRLVFAKRTRKRELLDQAALLWIRFGSDLDQEYLDYHTRFEDVGDMYKAMMARAAASRKHDGLPKN